MEDMRMRRPLSSRCFQAAWPTKNCARVFRLKTWSYFSSVISSVLSQLSVPEIDENAKLINSETDKAKRIDLTNQTAKIIWENVMTLPLYQRPELIAVKTKLANYGAFAGAQNIDWTKVGFTK